MSTIAEKRRVFRGLHEAGCFVIPNPWDVGTARYLQHLGFPALATTSAGAAFAMGRPDSDRAVSCDTMLEHVRALAERAVRYCSNIPGHRGRLMAIDPQAGRVYLCCWDQ